MSTSSWLLLLGSSNMGAVLNRVLGMTLAGILEFSSRSSNVLKHPRECVGPL